jgi:hypothetical protein
MGTVIPSSLPPIDAVDVVDLFGVDSDGIADYMGAAANARCVRVVGADAQRIASLWRKLPAGEQARCHIPPFGLRFYSNGRIVTQASICWECNNIFGDAAGERLFFEFNANGRSSWDLLVECKTRLG